MTDLSVLIPARNEQFLGRTIHDLLENIRGDTEIIVVCDGSWPDPPVEDHERVTLVYYDQSIGQRAATNEAARLSTAGFIMKCDAHCSFGPGFDVALMEDCEYDWTMVPEMRNLHVFDWQCGQCGHRIYQGPTPASCEKCDNTSDFEMVIVWKPRPHTRNRHMRFDQDLHFQYWREYKRRAGKGKLVETMSLLGACWMMRRDRYWELGGLDEAHGSWGQMGTEIACKTWLSGGRLVCSRKTWFAHMFRTQKGFKFPYPLSGSQVQRAREHSEWLWRGNNFERQIYPLSWLLEKFWPIPGWTEENLAQQRASELGQASAYEKRLSVPGEILGTDSLPDIPEKGIVYYTSNILDDRIFRAAKLQLLTSANVHDIVSVSLRPIALGRNIVLDEKPSVLTMFKEILAGLEASTADIIFLAEHDVLYHESHFEFVPPREDRFYYNVNCWKARLEDGHALKVDDCRQTSGLCASRDLLLEHYRKRIALVEEHGYSKQMGFEPGTHGRTGRVDDYKSETWMSKYPNIDIRHGQNMTPNRWRRDQFRNQKYTEGWTEAEEIPGWGRLEEVLNDLVPV